jgi:hypothetical protein
MKQPLKIEMYQVVSVIVIHKPSDLKKTYIFLVFKKKKLQCKV